MVSWLGASMYLTREAVGATLDEMAAFAVGTRLVMDYMLPAERRDEAGTTYVDLVAATTTERGEPWLSFFAPGDIAAVLAERGYRTVANLSQREGTRPLPDRLSDLEQDCGLRDGGCWLCRASVGGAVLSVVGGRMLRVGSEEGFGRLRLAGAGEDVRWLGH